MGLAEVLMSVASGGATGLLGAVVSRIGDYKNKQLDIELQKMKHSNELSLREVDATIMQLELEARKNIAATEAETAMEVSGNTALVAALNSEPKQYANKDKFTKAQNTLMVLLDFIRGVIRPGLTLYLCAITTAVWMQAGEIIKSQPIPVGSSVEIYTQITSTVLYLTSCCVLFWFGSRPPKTGKTRD